jgi:hypothetical protein
MECDPAASVETLKAATPAVRLTVPSVVVPSEKTTEPVGVPPGPETVAVIATAFCTNTGLGEAVSPATAAALLTVIECVTSVAAA